jgi:phosphoadenosine phosphosulfate reductase
MIDFAQHEKIAFQFSGGKDSLAALYTVKKHWDRMTVYWLDTGDAVPEVRDFVLKVFAELPHTAIVCGDQPRQIATFGWPSDLVSAENTLFAAVTQKVSGPVLRERSECCQYSLMQPLHARMIADGVTLIIRGQKSCDKRKSPLRSGDRQAGIQVYFPIENWSDEEVVQYLRDIDVGLPPFYDLLRSSPDCLTCTAYLDENRKQFLKERHPEAWQIVRFRLSLINEVVKAKQAELQAQLEE